MPVVVLERTSWAYPEQYDVRLGAKLIGYLRLRHGDFTARHPDVEGAIVYEAAVYGDGEFFDDVERWKHLDAAIEALLKTEGVA